MANQYVTEPQTSGKVVLNTSLGAIDIELWTKECPLASRNFLQHCLDGYYDNCQFHRVVPNFMGQTGDPTNTGDGGESAIGEDGAPFRDEFHGRLKFNRRGLVGMASSGPHTNQSQFFVTLGETPWLTKKHTLFGRIQGDTIYNVMRLNELELEGDEDDASAVAARTKKSKAAAMAAENEDDPRRYRPVNPPVIRSVEILVNPFDDMVRRVKQPAPSSKDDDDGTGGKKKRKKKRKLEKSLISFAGDEADVGGGDDIDINENRKSKSKAAYDLLDDADAEADRRLARKRDKGKRSSSSNVGAYSAPVAADSDSSDSDSKKHKSKKRKSQKHKKKRDKHDKKRGHNDSTDDDDDDDAGGGAGSSGTSSREKSTLEKLAGLQGGGETKSLRQKWLEDALSDDDDDDLY